MNPFLSAPIFGVVAFFYSLVGHGGASGYLAVGTFLGQPMGDLKVQALILNLGVAGVAAFFFARAHWMRWDILGWLCLGSIPAAWWATQVAISSTLACGLLAFALACSALRLLWNHRLKVFNEAALGSRPKAVVLFAVGLALGCLSGLTGVGGGIYLSPLLLLLRWADIKETAALSAAFILLNSAAGLVGLASQGPLPALPGAWLGATLVGGLAGSLLGAERMPKRRLAQVLAGVLFLAAIKLGLKALA